MFPAVEAGNRAGCKEFLLGVGGVIVHSVDIPRVDTSSLLTVVAQHAASATDAGGVAIAIGNAMAMCCCASVGDAPPVGTLVGPDSGLSGICMRTSELVQCDDAATDPRIDPVAGQRMNLRSVLIVPMIVDGRLQGMLQAVSSKPRAFDTEHRELLCRMAQRIATLLSDPNAQQKPQPLATQDQAASPSAASAGQTLAVPVAMRPNSTAGRSDDTTSTTATTGFRPKVVANSAAVPQSESREQKGAGLASGVQAEAAHRSRTAPTLRSSLSPTARAGVLIALLGMLAVGGYKFTGVGRSSSPAGTPVSAATNGSADASPTTKTDAAPPEISIELSSLAVGLEQAPAHGGNAPQLTPGQLLRKVEPVYPPSVRGMSGSVVLSALVNKQGRVANVRVVRGPPELASPAMDAVRQWVYEPYRLGGVPVAAESTIIIRVTPRKQR